MTEVDAHLHPTQIKGNVRSSGVAIERHLACQCPGRPLLFWSLIMPGANHGHRIELNVHGTSGGADVGFLLISSELPSQGQRRNLSSDQEVLFHPY